MNELGMALAFASGMILAGAASRAHHRKLNQVIAKANEQHTLAIRKLEDDRDYYRDQLSELRAKAAVDAAYEAAYVEGIRQGTELNDAERLAYSLEQKRPDRILRMDRWWREKDACNA